MNKYRFIIFQFIFLAVVFSCKNNKDATKSNSTTVTTKPGMIITPATYDKAILKQENTESLKKDSIKPELYLLLISFYSSGEGAEYDFIRKFEDSVGAYSGKVGKNIDYEKYAWGREGETDFCLKLNELTKAEQIEFIAKTTELLKTARFVHIYENQPCRRRKPH